MTGTVLTGVIDKLVSIFGAAVDVTVYDGAPATDAFKKSFVAVGWNGDEDDLDGDFATVENNWQYIGSSIKQETGSITCAVVAWSGDSEVKPRREAAIDLYSDCDLALRTAFLTNDAALQTLITTSVSVSAASFSGGQREGGNYCRGVFTVTYDTQI